ncbi:MlaD family protein [Arsenicibacter rosenii]|uniref:Mammalian cell entry protein n=1 Tax=Arsenicibacter rosenii TaxID=1750698 RepID=A0A1S2VPY5_9BACT|nr:MlaD family protein [Arsenicibacter rosenii]OIN60246.1 mammalian cell entry protein [Arsenicibacter rosenii]
MKLSQETKVGILAVVALAMLYFGFNFLKGSDFFSSNRQYEAIYDNVDGLTVSNPVQVNGFTVGRVKTIKILQDQQNQMLVTLDIRKDLAVGEGSKAILADNGLLGGKLIRLEVNQKGQVMEDGGRLVAVKESGMVATLSNKATPVLNNVDSLTRNLNRIVLSFDKTAAILNQTLAGANKVTGTLDLTVQENRAALRATLANVNRLSASLAETEKQVKPILAKASTFADSLNALQLRQTLATANQTVANLQKLLAGIQQGKGSIGKLTSDEALYANVNATTVSLERLLTDFRENPKRYVHFSLFGRKDKGTPANQAVTPGRSATVTVDTTK